MIKKIYKVFTQEQWLSFQTEKLFMGSGTDKKDGFIHFSTSDQLDRTIKKHFPNQANLVIAEFATQSFEEALKWEKSSSGEIYPHVYDQLAFSDVISFRNSTSEN